MNIQRIANRIYEIVFLLMFLVLPFSYPDINIKYSVFFIWVILISIIYLFFETKPSYIDTLNMKLLIPFIFIILLPFFKLNYAELLKPFINLHKVIPFSTFFFSVGFLAFLIKFLSIKQFDITSLSKLRYFFASCLILIVFAIILYPIFAIYHEVFNSNLMLLSEVLKYFFIILIVNDYLDSEIKVKRIFICISLSVSATCMLMFLFS